MVSFSELELELADLLVVSTPFYRVIVDINAILAVSERSLLSLHVNGSIHILVTFWHGIYKDNWAGGVPTVFLCSGRQGLCFVRIRVLDGQCRPFIGHTQCHSLLAFERHGRLLVAVRLVVIFQFTRCFIVTTLYSRLAVYIHRSVRAQ